MKLPCDLQTVYGSVGGSVGSGSSGRRARAVLMLTADKSDSRLQNQKTTALSVYTQRQDRRPLNYKLEHLSRVFTRHIDSGRVTICFSRPPHELHVRADSKLLQTFVSCLRRVVSGGAADKDETAQSSDQDENTSLSRPVKRVSSADLQAATATVSTLHVQTSAEYLRQRRSFPSGLQQLVLSGLKLRRVETSVLCRLQQLQQLDLSDNCLTRLPPLDSLLPQLFQLNVSGNQLSRLEPVSCRPADSRLSILDVSNNQLAVLPASLANLRHLHTLNVANNRLIALPESVTHLRRLRALNLANNRLLWIDRTLESAVCLETLDMHGNISPTSSSSSSELHRSSAEMALSSLFAQWHGSVPSLMCFSASAVCSRPGGVDRVQRHLVSNSVLQFLLCHIRCRQCSRMCCCASGVGDSACGGSARAHLTPGPLRHSRAALSHPTSAPLPLLQLECWWCCQLYAGGAVRRKRARV